MIAPAELRTRLAGHLEVPVVRAGLALVSSAGITSVLGLAYWSLAARHYSPAALGASAALIAAMDVIAAIANLGLKTALIRFVPALGPRAPRVVLAAYLASATVGLLGAGAFVVVHGRWFPELTLLDHGRGAAFFLASTVLWVVFFLQDSVLVGLRRSSWVPVENALFAVAKLGLLVALVAPMPGWGIYVSWVGPLLLVVLGVNLPAFRLLRRGAGQAAERLTVRDLVRFSAGDYLASTLWLAMISLLPLLVLALTDTTHTSWYHLSWTVGYTLYLVTSAVGSALVAEGAHDPAALDAHARRAAGQALLLVVPAAAAVAIGAPLLLDLFGAEYAGATTLLRLVALSAIPHVVTGVYVNLERARRRIRSVVVVYALLGAGVVGLTAVLVPHVGVTGAGVAWLLTQVLLAVALLATRLQDLWVGALPTPVIRALGTPGRWWGATRQRRRAAARLRELAPRRGLARGSWSVLHTTDDLVVAAVEAPEGPAVLKLTDSHPAELARRRELNALLALADEPALAEWDTPVPWALDHGTDRDHVWTLETRVPGHSGEVALDRGLAPDALLRRGADALAGLHRATGRPVVVDEVLLRSWVDEPVTAVAKACPELIDGLAEVAATLRLALADRTVVVAWTHGDLTPGNLLVDDHGSIAGVVDWEAARADRLAELDLVTLVASVRAASRTQELGEATVALLERPWTEEEVAVLAAGPNPEVPRTTLVLLAWLHHVAANLTKSEAYAGNRIWLVRNVHAVVAAAVDPRPPEPAPTTAPEPDPVPVLGPGSATPRHDPGPRTSGRPRRRLALLLPVVGVGAWFAGLRGLDVRDLGDTGLVSVLPPLSIAGLALVVVGLAVVATRPRVAEGLAAAHLGALVTMLFATPALAYPTLRYSWAWKHVGIVDYIDRLGQVDPGIDVLPVYHNWPGFFAGAQFLQRLIGADDAVLVAQWAPLALTLATVAAVVLLAGTFTEDRRVVWLAAGVFTVGNWVGQEYFSPQALVYLLYVVAVALAIRLGRQRTGIAATLLVIVALAVAIASSHQLTPAMLTVALFVLALVGHRRLLPLAAVAGVATLSWALWAASAYTGPNIRDAIDGFGQPLANAEGNLNSGLSPGQSLVALGGRALVLAVGVLALLGLVRCWRAGRRDRAPMVLLVAPLVLLAANDFGGEILFRVFLYALPAAAYFAAHALVDLPGLGRPGWRAAVPAAVLVALAGGFLLGHFGKDGHYVFTPEEVEAAAWVYGNAPPGSLLIEGSRNYPAQFLEYEGLHYVPLDREELAARREIRRQPVRVMTRWMADETDEDAYLLLTRSQAREAAALGLRPADLLDRLEDALRASPRFTVAFENRDAVVFRLRDRERWR